MEAVYYLLYSSSTFISNKFQTFGGFLTFRGFLTIMEAVLYSSSKLISNKFQTCGSFHTVMEALFTWG